LTSIYLQAAITVNFNVDELLSYSIISFALAGKFSKVVLTPDLMEESAQDEFGKICVDHLWSEK